MNLILSVILVFMVSCTSNKINYENHTCGGASSRSSDFDELKSFCECASNPINQGSISTITLSCASEILTWDPRTEDSIMVPSVGRIYSQITTIIGDIEIGGSWEGTQEIPVPVGCQTAHEVQKTRLIDIPMTCNQFLQVPDEAALTQVCVIALANAEETVVDTGDTQTTCTPPGITPPPPSGCISCQGSSGRCQWCHIKDTENEMKCLDGNDVSVHMGNDPLDHYATQAEWENGECLPASIQ